VQSKGGQWRIDSLTRGTGQRQPVLSNASMPLIGPGNRLFFYRDGQLLVSAFDTRTMKTSGSPEQVLENLPSRSEGVPPAMSRPQHDRLRARRGGRRLVWVSRTGVEEPVIDEARGYLNPRLSPDGTGSWCRRAVSGFSTCGGERSSCCRPRARPAMHFQPGCPMDVT
jgi:hypothetical protein